MKKCLSTLVLILVIAALFTGCGAQDPIVGTWKAYGAYLVRTDSYYTQEMPTTYTFDANGDFYIDEAKCGTWKAKSGNEYNITNEKNGCEIEGYIKEDLYLDMYTMVPGGTDVDEGNMYAVFKKE